MVVTVSAGVATGLSHHPVESTGPHGSHSKCPNDFGCPAYLEMRAGLLRIFHEYRPFLCAAGHDHSLQLLDVDDGCDWYLVSGSLTNTTSVRVRPHLLMGFDEQGLFRLNLLKDGAVILTAVHRPKKSGAINRISLRLE